MSDQAAINQPWLYEGAWGLLTRWFRVPREAPSLPTIEHESIVSRKPSPAFVSYLKFQFWLLVGFLLVAALLISIGLIVVTESVWVVVGACFVLLVILLSALIGYLAIHLRYDTTWYLFSDRSMRLRRGIWVIRESTITFENIQNVKVTQGPLQRYFAIADVVVETAGGGSAVADAGAGLSMHAGLIEGIADAAQIRDSIMNRVQQNASAGLGDEPSENHDRVPFCSPEHLRLLREIRDLAQQAC